MIETPTDQCKPPPPKRIAYRLGEVAEALGVSRRTVERARSSGRFPKPDAHLGKCPLWTWDTLVRWIAQGGHK